MNIEEMLAIIPVAMQTAIKTVNNHEMYMVSCNVNERKDKKRWIILH